MCLWYILIRFTTSSILPHLFSPLLRTILTGFIVLFSYTYTKNVYNTCPPLLSLFKLLFPTGIHPCTGLICPFCPSFLFKCILIVQGSFTLEFYTWTYCNLITLTPSSTYCFYIALFPYIQQLLVHYVIPASYTGVIYIHFYSHITVMFILSLSVYIYVYTYHISLNLH
jgi:hypothetical protein